MFNIGGGELLVILLVALIVLGPDRLPGAARSVGRVMGDLRRMSSGFQRELRQAFDDSEAEVEVRTARATDATPLGEVVRDVGSAAPAAIVPADGDMPTTGVPGPTNEVPDQVADEVANALDAIAAPTRDDTITGPDIDGDERAAS